MKTLKKIVFIPLIVSAVMYIAIIGIIIGFKAPVSALITFMVFWPILIFTVVGLIAWKLFFTSGEKKDSKDGTEKDTDKKPVQNQESSDWEKKYPLLLAFQKVGAILVFFFLAIFMFWFLHWFTTDKTEINKGLYHGTKEIIVGAKTPAQITADSLRQIDIDIANAEKARKKAEDE